MKPLPSPLAPRAPKDAGERRADAGPDVVRAKSRTRDMKHGTASNVSSRHQDCPPSQHPIDLLVPRRPMERTTRRHAAPADRGH